MPQCWRQNLFNHSVESLEGQYLKEVWIVKGRLSHKFLENGKDSIGNQITAYLHYILTKVEFCLCPENFNVVEFQSNGLILLAGQISE